jgi:hypothetical protein
MMPHESRPRSVVHPVALGGIVVALCTQRTRCTLHGDRRSHLLERRYLRSVVHVFARPLAPA